MERFVVTHYQLEHEIEEAQKHSCAVRDALRSAIINGMDPERQKLSLSRAVSLLQTLIDATANAQDLVDKLRYG